MHDLGIVGLAGVAGGALGAVYFLGLWWSVRQGLTSAHPARWFLGGLLVRIGATLAGFYLVGGGDWRRWAACLAGFVLARQAVTLRVGGEVSHAPQP